MRKPGERGMGLSIVHSLQQGILLYDFPDLEARES